MQFCFASTYMSCKLISLHLITASQICNGLALVRDVSMVMDCVVQQAAAALKRYSNNTVTVCFVIIDIEE